MLKNEAVILNMLMSIFTRKMIRQHGTFSHSVIVCPSVSPSQVSVLLRWLNQRLRKQCHTIAPGL